MAAISRLSKNEGDRGNRHTNATSPRGDRAHSCSPFLDAVLNYILTPMRNLYIYLSALSSLSAGVYGLRHGASQLRDLLAFPKYEIQFLNDLPLAESDAAKCRSLGISSLDEWLGVRAPAMGERRLGDGSAEVPPQVGSPLRKAKARIG